VIGAVNAGFGLALGEHPEYYACHQRVLDFLEHHAH
jgi:hypothetical protein